jgi:transposase
MSKHTLVKISEEAQAQRLAALRRARYGYLRALHIMLLCAVGRIPTAIAAVLFCARSSVYRTVRGYRTSTLGLEPDEEGRHQPTPPHAWAGADPATVAGGAAESPPLVYGWGRTRWSCATLALTLPTKRGLRVSAETMLRWLHEIGWVWKRAKLVAKDDEPQRQPAWRASGRSSSSLRVARPWSLPPNWIYTCGRKSAGPGCPQEPRWGL